MDEASSQSGDDNTSRSVSAKLAESLGDSANNLPVWVRAPKGGNTEFYTGLSRAKLYELSSKGHITSRSIREAGQVKGTRLFKLQSVLEFIEQCSDGTDQTHSIDVTYVHRPSEKVTVEK